MENLNIEQFNPKKAEIILLADKYRGLIIKDVNDKIGYKQVDIARKELKHTKSEIVKNAKLMRAEAITFQKKVIELEKEFVDIIEPVEKELQRKQDEINTLIEVENRRKLLPERIIKLSQIDVNDIGEEFILLMDNQQFQEFINIKTEVFLKEKERKIKEDEEKLRVEQEKLNNEKKIEQARIDARIEAEKTARIIAENEKLRLEKEKQDAIENERMIANKKLQAVIQEQKELERQKRYVAWLKENDYNEFDCIIKKDLSTNCLIMYKKIDSFKLK